MRKGNAGQKTRTPSINQQKESTDMIINRLISGSGVKKRP